MERRNVYHLKRKQIESFLPHRDPFLFIDEVDHIYACGDLSVAVGNPDKVGTEVVAKRTILKESWFLKGHFPYFPIVPGVLQLEMLAQAASFALYPFLLTDVERRVKFFEVLLSQITQVKFRKPVFPGETVVLKTKLIKCRQHLWQFQGTLFSAEEKKTDAVFKLSVLYCPQGGRQHFPKVENK